MGSPEDYEGLQTQCQAWIQEELVDRLGLTPAVAEQHKMELQLLLRFHNWNSYTAEEALRKNTLDAMEQAGVLTQNAKVCKCGGNPKCLFCDGTGTSRYYGYYTPETRRRLTSMGPAAQCLERRRLATGGPRTPPVLAALMAEIEEA